jgi:hypothetical protein
LRIEGEIAEKSPSLIDMKKGEAKAQACDNACYQEFSLDLC